MIKKKESEKRPNAMKELKKDGTALLLAFTGIVGGHLLYKGANKVFKIDASASKIKKAIPPAVILLGSGAGAFFVKQKEYRMLLGGAALSGAVHTTGVLLDKNLLAGLKGVEEEYELLDEAVSEQYNLDLPELHYSMDNDYQEENHEALRQSKPIPQQNSDDDYEDAEII